MHQARALLRQVTGQIPVYDDDCPDDADGSGGNTSPKMANSDATVQAYSLLPNPNDGNIMLRQRLTDETPVTVRVYNSLGMVVYAATKAFADGRSYLSLTSVAAGNYYLVALDGSGKSYVLRFTKK